MKVRFYHWYNMLLSAMLTWLGFGSCTDTGPDEYGPAPMYGTLPYANYHISGTVTDESGQPLKGIRVSMLNAYAKDLPATDMTHTDADGHFSMKDFSTDYISDRMLVTEDIDGPDNGGNFASDTTMIEKFNIKHIDDSNYSDRYEVDAEVKLKKKD